MTKKQTSKAIILGLLYVLGLSVAIGVLSQAKAEPTAPATFVSAGVRG